MARLKKVRCANCGKTTHRSAGRFNEAIKFGWKIYCSEKCERESKLKRKKLICENCGNSFERTLSGISSHNYCSQACAAIVNNKNFPKRKAEIKKCIECGKKFKKGLGNKKYCSLQCRNEHYGRSPRELIDIIKNTTKKIGRVPSKRNMDGIIKPCIRYFGSWNNAVIAAGLFPNRSHAQRMYKRSGAKAKDGHLCDSISELLIDDWLNKNKITHLRNTPYPDTRHISDWSVNFKNKTIFIEYFGLAKDSPRYDRSIKKKKTLCRKHNIKLIDIYPWDLYPKINLEPKLKIFL